MTASGNEAKKQELAELRERVAQLEKEIGASTERWQPTEFYTAYYAMAGGILGMFGAITSLAFNVVGSALIGQYPLRLIQVYLTFPLGARALELEGGMTLTLGCCLYIATGALLGTVFYTLLVRATGRQSGLGFRMLVASVLAAGMWLVHFYVILAWLQPVLFGGAWIVEQIPWWVGLATHLVYGWTLALIYPLGQYVPYRRQTEQA